MDKVSLKSCIAMGWRQSFAELVTRPKLIGGAGDWPPVQRLYVGLETDNQSWTELVTMIRKFGPVKFFYSHILYWKLQGSAIHLNNKFSKRFKYLYLFCISETNMHLHYQVTLLISKQAISVLRVRHDLVHKVSLPVYWDLRSSTQNANRNWEASKLADTLSRKFVLD